VGSLGENAEEQCESLLLTFIGGRAGVARGAGAIRWGEVPAPAMDLTLVISLAFLVSPLLGYVVLILPISTRQKFIVAGVSVVLLVLIPVVFFLLAGGTSSGQG
jgi:hypothetical protein